MHELGRHHRHTRSRCITDCQHTCNHGCRCKARATHTNDELIARHNHQHRKPCCRCDDESQAVPEDKDRRQNQVRIFNERERLCADRYEAVRRADRLHVLGETARNQNDETYAGNLRARNRSQQFHKVKDNKARCCCVFGQKRCQAPCDRKDVKRQTAQQQHHVDLIFLDNGPAGQKQNHNADPWKDALHNRSPVVFCCVRKV